MVIDACHNIGIQMKRKDLTKTLMMTSNSINVGLMLGKHCLGNTVSIYLFLAPNYKHDVDISDDLIDFF